MRYSILLVDDDLELNLFLCNLLQENNFEVFSAHTAKEAIDINGQHHIDLILLDLNLPDNDGKNIIQILRKDKHMPIIAITGKNSDIDCVIGLEIGMDDYIGKPFNPRELIARIRAVLRRSYTEHHIYSPQKEETYIFDEFRLLTKQRKLYYHDQEIKLTPIEFEYFMLFVRSAHQVLPRETILNQIHANQLDIIDRTVDVTVMRLRRKLQKYCNLPYIIKTVRSIGYVFDLDVTIQHL